MTESADAPDCHSAASDAGQAADLERAWRWIRRVAETVAADRFSGELIDADGARLTVDSEGGWSCSATLTDGAAELLSIWLPWCVADIATGPQVIAQLGQSLDGRIATVSGASHYVTGQPSLVHLHRLRALVDAVVVGAGTVVADDPQLTVRHVTGTHPLRVVLDPRGRVPAARRVFRDPVAPTWHLLGRETRVPPHADHVHVESLEMTADGVDPAAVIECLARAGCRRILIEGGGLTISRFLQAGRLDRLHSVVAPMLIGSGRPAVTLAEIDTLDRALRPRCRRFWLGEDVLFDLNLRRSADGA
ncbi:RibD family protein [Salinicola aestuarinus]|uniref:RibD family protein n=1 Tax=Salinicola aestuarinus TaxID=1949082 RepID=UPI001FD8C4B8|nr:RibD family protein [Salinicola aestuarinus]